MEVNVVKEVDLCNDLRINEKKWGKNIYNLVTWWGSLKMQQQQWLEPWMNEGLPTFEICLFFSARWV